MSYFSIQRLTPLIIGITPFLFGFTPLSPSSSSTLISQITFPPSGDRGAPKTTTGGGTRGLDEVCFPPTENTAPLVAMMPNRENVAKTASLTPVVYVHVPETTAAQGELIIVDSNNKEVYYSQFNLAASSGIIPVEIPAEANLMAGNTYQWLFSVICDPELPFKNQALQGKIEIVQLPQNMENQLKNAPPLEKAEIYATSELWFETLDTIAQLQPQETQAWISLLQSVGLESLSEKPLRACCVAQ
ncbi:MAG: DUF928 domain-containing protein [Microcystaceae cyanobacterium]